MFSAQSPLSVTAYSVQAGTPMTVLNEEEWTLTPLAVGTEDVSDIAAAAQAIRFAAVQCRLYPAISAIVQQSIHAAWQALDNLLARRECFIISYDGVTIAFDGHVFALSSLANTEADFSAWMKTANLHAIGLLRGIEVEELAALLNLLVHFDPREATLGFQSNLRLLLLPHVQVLTRANHLNLLTGAPIAAAGDMAPASAHAGVVLVAPPSDLERLETIDVTETDPRYWAALVTRLQIASDPLRWAMMKTLTRALREAGESVPLEAEGLDGLLLSRLEGETHPGILCEVGIAAEARLLQCVRAQDWETALALLEPLLARSLDAGPEIAPVLASLLDRSGELIVRHGMLTPGDTLDATHPALHEILAMLGERVFRPLLTELKTAESQEERRNIIHALCRFGQGQQGLLLQELRASENWFVARNLLQVLGEIGNEEALGAISEKLSHPEPRVRVAAISSAVRIARSKATPYLSRALDDEHPEVRSRAALLAGVAPQPRILEQLLRLIGRLPLGKEQPEGVQLAATLSLAHFTEGAAREALLAILNGRLFSAYRRKPAAVRGAALSALVTHLGHPGVKEAFVHALQDRQPSVRQCAEKICAEHPDLHDLLPVA